MTKQEKKDSSLDFSNNPLLNYNDFFNYAQFKTEHIDNCVHWIEKIVDKTIKEIESCQQQPTFENTVEKLQELDMKVSKAWIPVVSLRSMDNKPEMREPVEKNIPRLIQSFTKISHNKTIYEKLLSIQKSKAHSTLTTPQKTVVEDFIIGRKLSAVHLGAEKQKLFNEYSQKLSQLSIKFSNNIIDSIKDYNLVIEDKNKLTGIPEDTLKILSNNYKKYAKKTSSFDYGPWLITLDNNIVSQIFKFCKNRSLRKKIFEDSYMKNAKGKYDNTQLIKEILDYRFKLSSLLGFDSPAHLSLFNKMAKEPKNVDELHKSIADACKASQTVFIKKLNELFKKDVESFKDSKNDYYVEGEDKLCQWDIPYYTTILKKQLYDYNSELIRQYLRLDKVLDGMWQFFEKLFSVKFQKTSIDSDYLWHKDVTHYQVLDSNTSEIIAYLFFDPYSRPGLKSPGAWMSGVRAKYKTQDNKSIVPIAYVCCNFMAPTEDKPCLITFNDLTILFHEFGHALQQTLTTIDLPSVSGTSGVERDVVELPSQFMENWCYHKKTLQSFAKHYKTNQSLSDELFAKVLGSKNFAASNHYLRQIGYGMIDMLVHQKKLDIGEIFSNYNKIIQDTETFDDNEHRKMMLTSFSHIFAGGYSAGYYGYLWAKVMSEDAFSFFKSFDLDNTQKMKNLGKKFKDTILALGGSEKPEKIYRKFRGKDATIDAFLEQNGLKMH